MTNTDNDNSVDLLPPDRFEAILSSISDGVFTVDTMGRITCFNRAAEVITGFSKEHALGRPCHTIFQSDVCQDACALKYTLDTGEPIVDLVVSIRSAGGEEIPVSISTALVRDSEGRVVGGVETFRDLRQVEALRREVRESYTFGDIVTKSQRMRAILDLLPTIAHSESTVLITGESGTGKELVARAIHNHSPRSEGPLVAVNSAGIPDTLLEAELFGYEPGAFTGAVRAKPGRFAMAGGGTLFLDEIGDMSLQLQAKLLRVLQDGTYEALGGVHTLQANVRVLAATNRDLPAMIKEGAFREDLYYRLNIFELRLPPLRERMEDVPILVDHFIRRLSAIEEKGVRGIAPRALRILMDHDFPGNVRELQNAIEHAFVLSSGTLIRTGDLPEGVLGGGGLESDGGTTLKDQERDFILKTLARNGYDRVATARELGIHKSTLYRKVQKLGIELLPQMPSNHEKR
ncbi:MAG: sigma 54-interacting transcriptional regulator [Gemmatimonadota bacterium]|jgi:PAS domain S-box-containing protein